MKEILFQIGLWAYPGLAILYGFWAVLNFGAKRTLSIGNERKATVPDWVSGIHFLSQSVAFYLLYFATRDLPIDTNAFSFVIRMWWTAAFVSAAVMTFWHFGVLLVRYWQQVRGGEDDWA